MGEKSAYAAVFRPQLACRGEQFGSRNTVEPSKSAHVAERSAVQPLPRVALALAGGCDQALAARGAVSCSALRLIVEELPAVRTLELILALGRYGVYG